MALLLGTVLLSTSACSSPEKPEPAPVPPITRADIDGFWFGLYSDFPSASPESVVDEELLTRLVDAMNKSKVVDPWPVPSTPAHGLSVRLWLRDGTEVAVWVFVNDPTNDARIVRSNESARTSVQYPVYAPELLALTKELARQRLTPMEKTLVAPPDGRWLEE